MTKNLVIGLLVVVVVVAGGYFLIQSNQSLPAVNTTNNQTPTATTSTNPNATTPSLTLTLGEPIVETSQNFSASNSTASLTGQVTPNGVPTTYWFEYGEATGLLSRTAQQSIGSGFYPIPAPVYITGLRANTSYSFRLMASNSLGTVFGGTYTFKTNSDPVPKASTPSASTKSATSISRNSATLNGQVNGNSWQTNYWFEYGTDSNFGNITSITSVDQNNLTSSVSVSSPISGLEPLTKYYFRLNAQNQFGTVNGNTLNFTTSGPLNPGFPTVTTNSASNITSSGVRLNGRINPNGVDTTYWFEYSQDSLLVNIIGTGTPVQSISASTNTASVQANVNNLSRNTKYFYRLVGKNQYGTVDGDITSFTTRP